MASRRTFDPRRSQAEALALKGLAPPEIARHLHPGAVCSVLDTAIDFPEERIPNAGERSKHLYRRAILVMCREWTITKSPPTLLVVPCSASARGPIAPWDIELPDATPGFTKDRVVAYTSLLQPVLKSDVVEIHGDVTPETLQRLRVVLAQLLDLASIA